MKIQIHISNKKRIQIWNLIKFLFDSKFKHYFCSNSKFVYNLKQTLIHMCGLRKLSFIFIAKVSNNFFKRFKAFKTNIYIHVGYYIELPWKTALYKQPSTSTGVDRGQNVMPNRYFTGSEGRTGRKFTKPSKNMM